MAASKASDDTEISALRRFDEDKRPMLIDA
jgi:hypothetical protein